MPNLAIAHWMTPRRFLAHEPRGVIKAPAFGLCGLLCVSICILCAIHQQSCAQTGFRDYLNNSAGAQQSTVPGPILVVANYVGNYSVMTESNDADTGQFFRRADDIDQDANNGSGIFVLPDGNIVGLLTDFDDLHTFNSFFDGVTDSDRFGSGAVDAINVLWIDNERTPSKQHEAQSETTVPLGTPAGALIRRDFQLTGLEGGSFGPSSGTQSASGFDPSALALPRDEKRNALGLIYGFRAFQVDQHNRLYANVGIFQGGYWDLGAENQVVGPQAGIVWTRQRGKWSALLQGTVIAGYNHRRAVLDGSMGQELIPGALNRPLYSRPTEIRQHESQHEFCPTGEVRALSHYRLTNAITLKLAWSAFAASNLLFVNDDAVYQLPYMEVSHSNVDSLLVHDVFCGIEFVR
jgi:hypothetical protein